jgi:gluconokinase
VACSALREVYRDRLRARISGNACFLLLDNSHDELMRRLVARADHFMPANMLDSQLATLERPTVSETAKTLLSDISPDDLCAKAVDWLKGDLGVDRSG